MIVDTYVSHDYSNRKEREKKDRPRERVNENGNGMEEEKKGLLVWKRKKAKGVDYKGDIGVVEGQGSNMYVP